MNREELEQLQKEEWEEAVQEARSRALFEMALEVIAELDSAIREGRSIRSTHRPATDLLLRVHRHIHTEYEIDVTAALSIIPISRRKQ
jgi:hypothetical protein